MSKYGGLMGPARVVAWVDGGFPSPSQPQAVFFKPLGVPGSRDSDNTSKITFIIRAYQQKLT